jgi:hypothetical protein
MSEPKGPFQKCTGGDETEFIECKASTITSSKSTLADSDEKVSEDSSNAVAAVCEHELAPSRDEEIEFEWTKEALNFKWYEEPEDWDRLCPGDDDADMNDMKTRHRELYSSLVGLDKLKKTTTTKTRTRYPATTRHVGLLLKKYDSLLTEQGWSNTRESSGLFRKTPPAKEAQTTSTSMSLTPDSVKNPRTSKAKSRKPQTDLGNSDDIPLLSTTNATTDKSHMIPTMCAQSATPTKMWLQMLQEPKKEGRHLKIHNRSTISWRFNQGRFGIPECQ